MRTKEKRRLILILGLFAIIFAALFFRKWPISRKPETANAPLAFRIAPFDDRSNAFLSERERQWFAPDRDPFALSQFMGAAGLVPSVRSLTNLLVSSTPGYVRWRLYRWLRPRQALVENAFAGVKERYLERATRYDTNGTPTLRVSGDGHIALLWISTNALTLFLDGTNGMQETSYYRKK